jgi:spore cortex formation protein SpoVR/YcgB (stage V sporulation)
MKQPKQLELPLKIKGTSQAEKIRDSIPTIKQMIEDKKRKPKNLEYCSDDTINSLLKLYTRRF